jgi:aspartate racemase
VASVEFLKTIYELNPPKLEQDAPRVVLLSDPTFPDRTKCITSGNTDLLLHHLESRIRSLVCCGVSRIAICCITLHCVIPQLPNEMRRKLVSCLDLIFSTVIESDSEHLLLCSSGSRQVRLFEDHPLWSRAKRQIVLLDGRHQKLVHDLIYDIKTHHDLDPIAARLFDLLFQYRVKSFIAGCSELHLIAKRLNGDNCTTVSCVDPLSILASMIVEDIS